GAVVGGPSGSIVPAALFDVPAEPRGQVSPGTGGVVPVPEDARVADIVRTLVAYNAAESCGKCTPCREGLPRLLDLIDEAAASPDVEARARGLAETIQLASLCGLGQAAPLAFLRGLDAFRDRWRGPSCTTGWSSRSSRWSRSPSWRRWGCSCWGARPARPRSTSRRCRRSTPP